MRSERRHCAGLTRAAEDVLAFRGEADEAFRWIERAYRQRDPGLYMIKVDPLLKNIEAEPRYNAFLRKMNLPE
jgi:adenylate cyclase